MKKFLSLILVVVMLVVAMPVAVAEGNTYKVGDIIQFGSYPQSEVEDEVLVDELNELAPEWDDWELYLYYSGSGAVGSMSVGVWMRYTDVTLNGNKYRGVKFTRYRPYKTFDTSSGTYQDNNGYKTDTAYWFKFEPIDWRILNPDTGFVICETLIDSQPYSNKVYCKEDEYFNNSSYESYASDYETSSIRNWLNNDFYNLAFTDSEKEKISVSTLNNDSYYTSIGQAGYERIDSNETKDKIFLLSYDEAKDCIESSDDRMASGSDYAKIQGINNVSNSNLKNKSDWLLRSPGNDCEYSCRVEYYGGLNSTFLVYLTYSGIRPAFRFDDIKTYNHKHKYNSLITNPTCTEQGFITYTCECGDTYIDDYVKENGHSHISEITTSATHLTEGVETYTCHCGDTYTKVIPKLIGHTHTSSVTIEPTHLKEGVRTYSCACGDTYTELIDKLAEHSHNAVVTAPTCTDQGYTTYICECGDSYVDDYVDKNGHTFTNYISDGKATCVTDGKLVAKCDNCDETDSKTEKGTHKFNDSFTIDTDPTCTKEGIKSRHCLYCTEKIDVTPIGKLSHVYESVVTAPTCTAKGFTTYTCECGHSYVDAYVDMLAHTYTSVVIKPTCTQNGRAVYTCACGDNYTETIPATGHSFNGSACTECNYDKAGECSCNCHKKGIAGLIWKILNFFYKLFRINSECACGAAHY